MLRCAIIDTNEALSISVISIPFFPSLWRPEIYSQCLRVVCSERLCKWNHIIRFCFVCLFLTGCFHLIKEEIQDQRGKMAKLAGWSQVAPWFCGGGKALCPQPFVPQLSAPLHSVSTMVTVVISLREV